MKNFFENILIEVAILILLFVILLFIGPLRIANNRNVWILPSDKHILFCGASAITLGINDSLTSSAINKSKKSERYLFTFLKLRQYLKYNPQIDTIFIQFAPTDIWQNADDKYFLDEQLEFMPLYWQLFGVEEWNYLKSDVFHIMQVILPRLREKYNWSAEKYQMRQGGYEPEYKCFDRIADYPKRITSSLQKGNIINHSYCRKIIDLCLQNDIKLYFLFLPVWNLDKVYDVEYYYAIYNRNFRDVELIDYSKIEMDDCERYDAHHLNTNGAKKITNQLKNEYCIR